MQRTTTQNQKVKKKQSSLTTLERAEILELKKKKVLAETPYFRPKSRAFVGEKRGDRQKARIGVSKASSVE